MTIAVYPGSFDPITNGHIDIAARAARLFDKIIVGVYKAPCKVLFFSAGERLDMAKRALAVDFARRVKAQVMVRGLRVSADFEREFDMAMMNRKLGPELELVCFMASPDYQFLRSSLLKEVAKLGGNIESLVPRHVAQALRKKEGAGKM